MAIRFRAAATGNGSTGAASSGQFRQHRVERGCRQQPEAASTESVSQCSQFRYSRAAWLSELLAARSQVRTEPTRELNQMNSNHHKIPCVLSVYRYSVVART